MESTLALIAATWAIVMALGPLLQIRTIIERKSSQDVSIGYFAVLLVGVTLWAAYGFAAASLALIVPNVVAIFVLSATTGVAARHRHPPP